LQENFFQFDEFVLGTDKSGKAWENLLIGMQYQQSPAMDASMANNVLDFLFCENNCKLPGGHGQDLAARNIQRGRDHGLQPYVKFREFCGLAVPDDWNDRPLDISETSWKNLQKVYNDVHDIDPFTGGLSENAVEGGLVGETFACIIGLQFAWLKDGDRFFFTHSAANGDNDAIGLPPQVKDAIINRNLGDVICDNTDAWIVPTEVMRFTEENQDYTGSTKICKERNKLEYSDLIELLPSTPIGITTATPATTTDSTPAKTTETTPSTTTGTTPGTTAMTANLTGWQTGWCNDKSGVDQNSGVKSLGVKDSREQCLVDCKKEADATGCEFEQTHGKCWVHTKDVGSGDGIDLSYHCFVFPE